MVLETIDKPELRIADLNVDVPREGITPVEALGLTQKDIDETHKEFIQWIDQTKNNARAWDWLLEAGVFLKYVIRDDIRLDLTPEQKRQLKGYLLDGSSTVFTTRLTNLSEIKLLDKNLFLFCVEPTDRDNLVGIIDDCKDRPTDISRITRYAIAARVLSVSSALELTASQWEELQRARDMYPKWWLKKDSDLNWADYAIFLSGIKVISPQKYKESFAPTSQELENLMEKLNEKSRQRYIDFAQFAMSMAIIKAEEVEVGEDGIKFVFGKNEKLGDLTRIMPEERSF